MVFVEPDYYGEFHCIADKCRHSCCIGWEIDIDKDSFSHYVKLSGDIGRKIRSSVSQEGGTHFILDENERCPLLRSDGLCELILSAGEDSLCDICREHPRFYNELPDRCEVGLGMCCEEAARLLLQGNEPVSLIVTEDGEVCDHTCPQIVCERDKLLDLLADRSLSVSAKLAKLSESCGFTADAFNASSAARFYSTLEIMDDGWLEMLKEMSVRGSDVFSFEKLDSVRYERIAEYFIYRHYIAASDKKDADLRLAFAILSTKMVCCLDNLGYSGDSLRIYSSEIEYSDENIPIILKALSEGILTL